MEGSPLARVVSFASSLEARELIVDVDDAVRRLVWAIVGGRMSHHNASMQIFGEGANQARVVWAAGLPNELAPAIAGMI